MTERDRNIVKDFMKTLSDATRICINKVYKKYQPNTVEELINLSIKCLEGKEDSSGDDYIEQKKILGLFKGEYIEIQDLSNSPEQDKEVTYKPKKTPK